MREWKSPQLPVPYPLVIAVSGGNNPNPSTYIFYGQFNENPIIIGIGIKAKRLTYKLIKETGDFTVNFVGKEILKGADLAGIVSGWKEDKSSIFKWLPSRKVSSPIINGSPLSLEVRYLKEIPFTDHILLLGEVQEVVLREDVGEEDFVLSSYSKATYYKVGEILGKWGFSRRGI